MLEEAAEHRADADVLAQALDAGHERADRAHDEVDLGARLRRLVELLDDVGSVRLFTLILMRARLPASAAAATARICSTSRFRRLNGATRILRNCCGRPKP